MTNLRSCVPQDLRFQIQTAKLLMANHPDIVVDTQRKKVIVINVTLPSQSEKYQWLREEQEEMWSCGNWSA